LDLLPPARQKENEWTVAVDLTLSFDEVDTHGGHYGAQHDTALLKELAVDSADKPVTIVAQAVTRDDKDSQAKVNRFVIRDGKVEELPEAPAGSYSQDITDLLKLAGDYPAKRLGLVVTSHGEGGAGMRGEEGLLPLPEFERTVAQALQQTDHKKLDLLDFDACDMAQTSVLDHTHTLTTDLVASSDVEQGAMQRQDIWLRDLLHNPNMTGSELGDDIIAQATKGANVDTRFKRTGTPTLAHFDLQNGYEQFRSSLDKFGAAMQNVFTPDSARKQLAYLLDHPPAFYQANDYDQRTRFDLQILLMDIMSASYTKQLADKNKTLSNAARDLLGAKFLVTKSFTGASATNFNVMGGLSILLPAPDAFDTTKNAQRASVAGGLLEMTDAKEPIERRRYEADNLQEELDASKQFAGEKSPAQFDLDAIQQTINRLKKPKLGDAQIAKLDSRIHKTTAQMLQQEPFQSRWMRTKSEYDRDLSLYLESENDPGQWYDFIKQWYDWSRTQKP
jgi:hypothetical protein